MLSRKKGRRYGEGHQKAPQISMCLLPLEEVTLLEEASCLPGFRPKRNAGHLLMCPFAPFRLGACATCHTMAVQGGR